MTLEERVARLERNERRTRRIVDQLASSCAELTRLMRTLLSRRAA